MICPNCGKELKEGSVFCMYCGQKIDNEVIKAKETAQKLLEESNQAAKQIPLNAKETVMIHNKYKISFRDYVNYREQLKKANESSDGDLEDTPKDSIIGWSEIITIIIFIISDRITITKIIGSIFFGCIVGYIVGNIIASIFLSSKKKMESDKNAMLGVVLEYENTIVKPLERKVLEEAGSLFGIEISDNYVFNNPEERYNMIHKAIENKTEYSIKDYEDFIHEDSVKNARIAAHERMTSEFEELRKEIADFEKIPEICELSKNLSEMIALFMGIGSGSDAKEINNEFDFIKSRTEFYKNKKSTADSLRVKYKAIHDENSDFNNIAEISKMLSETEKNISANETNTDEWNTADTEKDLQNISERKNFYKDKKSTAEFFRKQIEALCSENPELNDVEIIRNHVEEIKKLISEQETNTEKFDENAVIQKITELKEILIKEKAEINKKKRISDIKNIAEVYKNIVPIFSAISDKKNSVELTEIEKQINELQQEIEEFLNGGSF